MEFWVDAYPGAVRQGTFERTDDIFRVLSCVEITEALAKLRYSQLERINIECGYTLLSSHQ